MQINFNCIFIHDWNDKQLFERVFVCQNPVKQAPEMQSSTAELITGLVQLVPLTNTTQLSQEAMEVRDQTHVFTECTTNVSRCYGRGQCLDN